MVQEKSAEDEWSEQGDGETRDVIGESGQVERAATFSAQTGLSECLRRCLHSDPKGFASAWRDKDVPQPASFASRCRISFSLLRKIHSPY